MRTAQSRQKSYADKRRRPLEFSEGDHVFLINTPKLGLRGVFKTKKLSPRYIGSFSDTQTYRFSSISVGFTSNHVRIARCSFRTLSNQSNWTLLI